ncbi:hypothetical protein ABIB90_008293 [Bradyrhizobium sp. JR4.1]
MPPDPKIANSAPNAPQLTPYDEQHAVIYMGLLDAEADKGDWRDVARIVLGMIPPLIGIAPAVLLKVIWLAPSGRRVRAFGISWSAVGRRVSNECVRKGCDFCSCPIAKLDSPIAELH